MEFDCPLLQMSTLPSRRCSNANVHSTDRFKVGLLRVHCTTPAETMVKVFDKHLEEFCIDSSRKTCASIIDGAPIMSCSARKMKFVHAMYMAHNIQKGINVLYPKCPSQGFNEGIMDGSDTDGKECYQDDMVNWDLNWRLVTIVVESFCQTTSN